MSKVRRVRVKKISMKKRMEKCVRKRRFKSERNYEPGILNIKIPVCGLLVFSSLV